MEEAVRHPLLDCVREVVKVTEGLGEMDGLGLAVKHRLGEEDMDWEPEFVKLPEEVPEWDGEAEGQWDTDTVIQLVGEMVRHALMVLVKVCVRDEVGVKVVVPLVEVLRHWVGVMVRE